MENRLANLIQHATVAPQSVIDLLKNTLIGTEGSLYQLLDTESKIHLLDHPHFFYIERNNKALGTITICERNVSLGKTEKQALYIRYFAFDSAFQGSGNKARDRNSIFDQHWKKIFNTGSLSDSEVEFKSTFFWAYIDPQNFRSFNMNERFGFETIGKFRTIAFSRFKPKPCSDVTLILPEDKREVIELIKKFYSNYSFFSEVHLFDQNNFYALKENGKIVAGIQANPAKFKIISLPGIGGKIALKVFPKLPYLKKIVNPSENKFLATEGLFWLDGYENQVEKLLNAVLHLTKHHSMMIWEDASVQRIRKLPLKWGTLQKIKKDNEINIVLKDVNLSAMELDILRTTPKYLSGFDMT